MIHVQHANTRRLDMTRFNDAFMMHTSTSPPVRDHRVVLRCRR